MEVRKINCRRILSKSGIYGVDYTINPYVGCEHACIYCYARGFVKEFINPGLKWGEEVIVKENAPAVLARELPHAKRGRVLLSSITDPYQPVEEKFKLSREILRRLLEFQFPVSILTKSPLVKRDLDLISKFKEIEVGFTIITLSEEFRELIEPNAPSIQARLETLRFFKERGIKTYMFVGPILPIVTELYLNELIKEAKEVTDEIIFDKFNFRYNSYLNLKEALNKSDLWWRMEDRFSSTFYRKTKEEVKRICSNYGVKFSFCY